MDAPSRFVPQLRVSQPFWNVALLVEDPPDIYMIVAFNVENHVRVALQWLESETRQAKLVRVARRSAPRMARDVFVRGF